MVDYCHTPDCLRSYILNYFGEPLAGGCGNCGNCDEDSEKVDVTVDAQKALSCVYRMKERFGLALVAEVLKGSKNKKVLQMGFDSLPTYGLFAERTLQDIKTLLQRLVATGYLSMTESEFPVLKLTQQAIPVLRNQAFVHQRVVQAPKREADNSLFESLRQLRKALAERDKVPPYVVFADSTLKEMCQVFPQTEHELRKVKGVGDMKLERYGQEFLKAIRQHSV
jgi:ATP-dependent DNA helicase RecQ